nr:hypothetical protein [Mycoplasmopsis bovis]
MYYDDTPLYRQLWNFYDLYRNDNSDNSTLFEQSYIVSLLGILLGKYSIPNDLIIESLKIMIQRGEIYFDNLSKRLSLNEIYEQELFISKKLIKIRDQEIKKQIIPLPSQNLSNEQKEAYSKCIK